MPYEKTNAIVIRRADYSETSLVLTFYARTFGRISALAKGAKRKRSRIIGHVDLLSHGEIVFASARGRDRLHILSEACAFETFPSVRRKVERYYAGCHAAALVENLTAPDDPNPDVFDRLLGLLRGLEAGVDPAVALPAFEAHLLVLTGFMPEVTACVTCGKEIRVPAVAFSPRLGGVICDRCSPGEADLVEQVPSGALALLGRLAQGKLTRLERIRMAPAVAREIRVFLDQYETYILGKSLRTTKHL